MCINMTRVTPLSVRTGSGVTDNRADSCDQRRKKKQSKMNRIKTDTIVRIHSNTVDIIQIFLASTGA